jgi:hypothetical protein
VKPFAVAFAALFLLVNAALPATAQEPLQEPEPMLRLDVTSMSPRIVTHSDETLKITARVTNISDQPIENVKARLEAGAQQQSSTELGTALRAGAPTDVQRTLFKPLTPILQPGDSAELTIEAGLQGGLEGLLFGEPGVYPLLVNVNATVLGSEARLAALNLLLPVRSLPGGEPARRPAEPMPLSVIWPIASKPRVVADPVRGSVVLADDTLADELRPGGRLYALVEAARQVRAGHPGLFDGVCFAVDPELLATVNAMTERYRVRQGLSTVLGSGGADAKAWLSSLRELVDGGCVLTTTYAGADLRGLAARAPELATASAAREDVIRSQLDVRPLPGAIWSTDPLTDRSVQALSDARRDLVIASSGGFNVAQRSATPKTLATGDGGSSQLRVLPYDWQAALALTPGSASKQLGFHATMAADDDTIAGQNAVATVLFKAADDPDPGPLLLAPPRVWDAEADELRWMLSTLGELHDDGVVEATGLSSLADAGTDGTVRPGASGAAASGSPSGALSTIAELDATVADLAEAMDEDPTEQVDPQVITDPLRNALLRASSSAWRGDPSARGRAVDDAQAQLDDVLESVVVSNPGRTISLASGSSPIPVSIANRLPVQITVQVALSSSSGLQPSEVSALEVPAGRSRNLKIPAEALRAGRFTVDVELTTPGGTRLGEPTRFELASTEYGAITVIVTATAAGALLLLAGRRIYRRLRANGAAARG